MSELAKPMQFYYVPPDILNFPTQNKKLAKDFNFLAEMFKFMPKIATLAYEGKRMAGEKDENTHEVAGWKVTDEWYQALNEYTISNDALYDKVSKNDAYNLAYREGNSNSEKISRSNEEALNKRGDWAYDDNLVAGFVHFNNGLDNTEYFWGENAASSLVNADYDAQGNEWNHLEKCKPLGLAGLGVKSGAELPKDTDLEAEVEQAYFINDFLGSIGSSWGELEGILDKLSGQSYYQMVMNAVQPGKEGASYAVLSNRERTILIASMVESRNRVYSIATEVFGPVAATWDDQQMMAHFDDWMAKNYTQGASHGINAFRLILETSHQMLNQIHQFSKTSTDTSYTMSILDRYAFRQYQTDSGMEYFNKYSAYGNFRPNGQHPCSDKKGAIFSFIDEMVGSWALENDDIRAYLCRPLTVQYRMSFDTTVDQMPDPPGVTGTQARQLKSMKWLIEQWFGASTWIRPNYNDMPKPVAMKPDIELYGDFDDYPRDGWGYNNGGGSYLEGYKVEYIDGQKLYLPSSIAGDRAYSARSLGWDRVAGPFDFQDEDNLVSDLKGGRIKSGTDQWYSLYMGKNGVRDRYTLGYVSPLVPYYDQLLNDDIGWHNTYSRKQFAGLDQQEIMGRQGFVDPYFQSWAVNIEGKLTLKGEKTDKIRLNLFSFMDQAGTQRYKRAKRKYEEDKEDLKYEQAQEEKQAQKIAGSQKNDRKRAEQQTGLNAQRQQKAHKPGANKGLKKSSKKA